MWQYSNSNSVSTFKIQYSNDSSTWYDVGSYYQTTYGKYQTVEFGDVGSHQYWRILATSATNGGAVNWLVNEVEMLQSTKISCEKD